MKKMFAILFVFIAFTARPIKATEANSEKLIDAIESSQLDQAQRLLDAGADVNYESGQGSYTVTPLGVAIERQNLEAVRLLLSYDANVRIPSENRSPIELATLNLWPYREKIPLGVGQDDVLEIAKLILKAGGSPETALETIRKKGKLITSYQKDFKNFAIDYSKKK